MNRGLGCKRLSQSEYLGIPSGDGSVKSYKVQVW